MFCYYRAYDNGRCDQKRQHFGLPIFNSGKEGDFLADKLNGIWEEQDMTPSDRDYQDGDNPLRTKDIFTFNMYMMRLVIAIHHQSLQYLTLGKLIWNSSRGYVCGTRGVCLRGQGGLSVGQPNKNSLKRTQEKEKRMSENSDEFSDHLEEPLVIGDDFMDDILTAVQKVALTREASRKQQLMSSTINEKRDRGYLMR